MKTSAKYIFDQFSPNVLNEQEMNIVLGGIRRKPKSRDKDIFDDEENE